MKSLYYSVIRKNICQLYCCKQREWHPWLTASHLLKLSCFSLLFGSQSQTLAPFASSSVSQSIKASQGSIMTHCSGTEGDWWPGLIVSEPCLLGWTESLLIYIRLIPAATYVLTLVTKERCTCWFFSQRLIDLIRPRYQQNRDIITFVREHTGTFQRGTVEGELSHWECVCAFY